MTRRKHYGVAIAGTGYVGVKHIQATLQHPRAELLGVMGGHFDKTEKIACQYNTTPAKSFEQLIELPGVDGAVMDTDASLVFVPQQQTLYIAKGRPCEVGYDTVVI